MDMLRVESSPEHSITTEFGEDTKIVRMFKDRCVAFIRVQISPVFWGWVFRFVCVGGGDVHLAEADQGRL